MAPVRCGVGEKTEALKPESYLSLSKGEDSKGGEDFWASATRSHTNTIPQRIELCGR